MFFRMLRLRAPVGSGSSSGFPLGGQPLGISENAHEESQGPLFRWLLVQPMHIASGRFGAYPEIPVASSRRK